MDEKMDMEPVHAKDQRRRIMMIAFAVLIIGLLVIAVSMGNDDGGFWR